MILFKYQPSIVIIFKLHGTSLKKRKFVRLNNQTGKAPNLENIRKGVGKLTVINELTCMGT